jgi:hypothetical protein
MNYATLISPTDFRDFAKVHGWKLVPEAVKDGLFVLNHSAFGFRQLIVPIDTDGIDYNDAVSVAIQTIADTEDKSFEFIESCLMEAGSDTIRFGVSTRRDFENSPLSGLPLNYAVQAFKGVENAIRAAACSEVQRQPFHPKMKRSEAQRMVEAAQMRHTESGSFILKVACPIDAIPMEQSAQDELRFDPKTPKPTPFVRRAIIGMSDAIIDLVGAIETDKLDALIEKAKKDGASSLSANLCDGLMAFQDDASKANLNFSVAWSARLEPPAPIFREKLKIQWDYFPRIQQVATALRPIQPAKKQSFIGIVDELKGDLGKNDQREGEVILNLQVFGEAETVKAKADLNIEQYKQAHLAHIQGKTYVRITGLLNPGNQPRKLTEIEDFSLIANK